MNKHICLPIIACISTLLIMPTAYPYLSTATTTDKSLIAAQISPDEISQIAHKITVKVFAGDSRGSGILIAHQGQVYTVLTNAHVVSRGTPYRIQTPDGKVYPGYLKYQGESLKGNDLAVLQFHATTKYSIATFADSSTLAENQSVYAAGFPFEQDSLNLTTGKIALISPKPLVGGYQIGYTNEIRQGMSGGAVLNQEGKLIGVVGLGASAILNDAYVYQDGTHPNPTTLEQLRSFSFAVPIATLALVAPQFIVSHPGDTSGSSSNHPAYTGILGEVDKIAQQITVRIDASKPENGHGSGVIIAKNGQIYYVLTASHVVKNQDNYQIVTPDGRQYPVPSSEVRILEAVDLAVVPFTSSQTYQVATIAKYNFRDRLTPVFVSGVPQLNPDKTTQSQRMLTFGLVLQRDVADFGARDKYSLSQGQELLYTNLSYRGMSGGAVLDTKGRVVGINTAAEDELLNNQEELSVGYSLGVPISDFLSLTSQDKILQPGLREVEKVPPTALPEAELVSIKNQLSTLTVPSKDGDVLAWLNYGNYMWRAGNYESALAAFERAIQMIQQLPDFNKHLYALAYYGKGLTLLYSRNNSSAVVAFEQATQIDANFPQAWHLLGKALNELKKYPEALTAYKQALKIEPKDFVLNEELGDTLDYLKLYQDAIAAYSKAIELKKNSWAYNNRGIVYKELKEYQKALDDYNKALAINPDYAHAYNNRGTVYSELKEYQKALDDYNKALAINPDFADAYDNRGIVYGELKEYQKALANFNKALAINPDYANAYLGRGLVYYELKEYQKALADYNKALAINHDDADAYYNRGLVYDKLKEYQKALADYNKALAINPDYAYAYDGRGIVYYELKEYQKALDDYNKALVINHDDAYAYYNRGNVYYELKEYQKALDDYNKALAINHDYAYAYLGRGLVYYELKEYQKALADWQKAAQLFYQQQDMQNYQFVQELIKRLPNNP